MIGTPSKKTKFKPLGKKWLKHHYWKLQKTFETIAIERKCNANWVCKEVRRHGLQKSKNGIKYRGKKNYIMPDIEKQKHHKQPHAKEICTISPFTLTIKHKYRSTIFAAKSNNTKPNRIRTAMNLARKHKGYYWAYAEDIEKTIAIYRKSIMIEMAALLREGVLAEKIS
jgi:hypothetical protein